MGQRKDGYLDQVMSLFRLGGGAEADAVAAHHRAAGPARAPGAAPGDATVERERVAFEAGLKDLAARRDPSDPVVAGKVHLIHLGKTRERMGPNWPKYAERVHGLIRAELKARLTQHDHFTQVNRDTYAVVFGDCSAAEARLKMALLCEQILAKLFGESEAKDLDMLGVETLVTRADGRVAAEALESVDALIAMLDHADVTDLDPDTHRYRAAATGERALTPQEVSDLLGEVNERLTADTADPGPGPSIAIRVDRLGELVRQLEYLENSIAAKCAPSRPTPAHERADDSVAWEEIKDPAMEAVRRLKARAERRLAFVYEQGSAGGPAESANSESTPSVSFTYMPMWHAPSQRTGVYLCQAKVEALAGDLRQACADAPDVELEIQAILDRLTLRRARQDLQKSCAEGHLSLVAVPIQYSTLRRHGSQQRVLEIASHLQEELRRLLIWEVCGVPVHSWSARLAAVTEPIRKFGGAIFLRLDDAQDNYPDIRRGLRCLRAAGVREVGLDVRDLRGSEAACMQFIERFAGDAKANGLKCYGHGFETLGLTICAVGFGFQHVSGPAVAAPIARPQGIHPTTVEAIYGHAGPST